jgi:general nucleoside transport system permease protein
MQLVLERRAERSTLIAVASPLAVALTIGTFAILFAIMGKNPPAGALAS